MSNPLNLIFTCHGLIQGAVAFQTLFYPHSTSFLFEQALDTTSLFLLRFYGATLASLATISLMSQNMPNMLPCKRAAACGFLVFHGIMTLLLIQTRGENPMGVNTSWILSGFHGIQGFILYAWYSATANQVKSFLKSEKNKTH